MDRDRPCHKAIAQSILRFFEHGLVLDDRATHFIDSTFMTPSGNDIRCLLETECDDRDLLLSVAVVPDNRLRLEAEAILQDSDEKCADAKSVTALMPDRINTAIIFPDSRGKIPCVVPKSVAAELVLQLCISVKTPPQIWMEVEKKLGADRDLRLATLSMIRNARLPASRERILFVAAFVKMADIRDADTFLDRLGLVLRLAARSPGAGMFDVMAAEKAACMRALRKSKDVEKQLEKNNIETMMLKGKGGLLCVDREELLREIRDIDIVSMTVFGKIPHSANAGSPHDVVYDVSFEKKLDGR